MSSAAPRIALASPRDQSTVLELLSEHMPRANVARRYDWLYRGNPHGEALTLVAFDGETDVPMGLTSLFPRRVIVHGEVRVGAIGGDGYVRPAFRRRGVATALHRACLAMMAENLRAGSSEPKAPAPVEFMYGAPVPNNLKALEHAGSRTITRLVRYARPSPIRILLRAAWQVSPFPRPRLVEISGPDTAVAEIWERAADNAAIMPVRDPAHYAWRFGRAPSGVQRPHIVVEGGRPVAVCALERRGDSVALVDFLAPRDRYAPTLRSVARATGAAVLTTLVNAGSPTTAAMFRAGFIPREATSFQVLAPPEHPAAETLFDPASWHYMWGDGDLDRVL